MIAPATARALPLENARSAMRLLNSLTLSGISVGARLAAAMVTFAIVARVLGPQPFGLLMFYMSVATLLALASNFGLVVYLMRAIGQAPDRCNETFAEVYAAKLIATALTLLSACVLLVFLNSADRVLFLILLGAMLSEAFTEFFNGGFRARARFDLEARLSFIGAWVGSLSVGLVACWTGSLLSIALAYLLSRLLVAVLTWHQLVSVVGPIRPAGLLSGLRLMKSAASYALDSGLTSAFGQVDSVVLQHQLGAAAVGVHQAGMRLFMAGSQAAGVLANVFLPRAVAAHAAEGAAFAVETGRLQMAFLGVGLIFGLALALGGRYFVPLLFGEAFAALLPLMPWFGLLFAIKFAAAAWGLVLTAKGRQTYRSAASLVHWLLVAVSAFYLVPHFGNLGWLMSLVAGNTLLLLLYAVRAATRTAADLRILGLSAVLLLIFVPTLGWV